jgi:uncharacterized peroxidase-related enzyme
MANGTRQAVRTPAELGKHPPMAHIRLIDVDEATGELRLEYDAAIERAGKVFNIVKAMSLRPRALRAAMDLYREVMFGRSELSRADRELLAVVVSCTNDCHYWIRAHADDLRAEGAPDELAEHAAHDYRAADLDPRRRALCDFAALLTRDPRTIGAEEVDVLRRHGLSDEAIHDAIQVVSFFNYINRIAEGVGIEPEPDWDRRAAG